MLMPTLALSFCSFHLTSAYLPPRLLLLLISKKDDTLRRLQRLGDVLIHGGTEESSGMANQVWELLARASFSCNAYESSDRHYWL
jgi:hypothetical protein